MNNKHLSWNKEINNNFIIASRAYFLQSPTCTRVNNLDHITMWLTSIVHIIMWLTPIVHIAMWPTPKGFTRFNNLVHIAMWLTPKEWSCFACERNLVNGSVTFRVVCILQIFYVYNALHGATVANCSQFQYVSRLRHRVIRIGVKSCIDVTLYDELFITSITEKYFLSPLR